MGARVKRLLTASVAGSAVIFLGLAASATAANSPTKRDCSFGGGFDPDFVQLMGAKPKPNGVLVAPRTRKRVRIEASESPSYLDQMNHVSLKVTVTTGMRPPRMASGSGTGSVLVSAPLTAPRAGRRYTIAWTATFDNGLHNCPSSSTPQNTSPRPFVVKVKRR